MTAPLAHFHIMRTACVNQGADMGVPTPSCSTQAIVEQVAARHGVTVEAIKGPCRLRKIVDARFEAIQRVSEARPTWSYPRLGEFFGGRDHTTIMAALKRVGAYKPRGSRYHGHVPLSLSSNAPAEPPTIHAAETEG